MRSGRVQAVKRRRPFMETTTRWFLDQRIETGEIDLVEDLTSPVPAVLTMDLVGLPLDDWASYVEFFHGTIAHRPGSDEFASALAKIGPMRERLVAEAADRRRNPRDDLLTDLVQLEVDGVPLTDDEVQAVLWNLVGGGLEGCRRLLASPFAASACARIEVARLSASSRGFAESGRDARPLLTATVVLRAQRRIVGPASLFVEGGPTVPFVRERFAVDGVGVAYDPSPIAGSAALGAAVDFE